LPAHLFEGPEKKVELLVKPGLPSLRGWGREAWTRIVQRARADVVSVTANAQCDAYLLSESSLFVYDDHLVMITCGRTQLVEAVAAMLERIGVAQIALLIYERKNEHFPQNQPTTFEEDAARLCQLIPGRAFRFGHQDEHLIQLYHSSRPFTPEPHDTTLEILMHGIAEEVQTQFRPPSDPLPLVKRALAPILSGAIVDDHVFEPAGYSLNALLGKHYATLHVTPQEVGSYVSFETNLDFRDGPEKIIEPVIQLFQPKSFDLFSFVPGESVAYRIPDYRLRDHVACELECGYHVAFQHHSNPVSRARRPEEIPLAELEPEA
jgi:S-adenosylmethionine decarboxylase